jgi:hypothetical protein
MISSPRPIWFLCSPHVHPFVSSHFAFKFCVRATAFCFPGQAEDDPPFRGDPHELSQRGTDTSPLPTRFLNFSAPQLTASL